MRQNHSQNRGFTLLEILIVVGIIAAVIGAAIPRIRKNNTNMKSVVRELGVLSREVRSYAQLKNATYRLVFNLNGQEDSYWVEASNRPVLAVSEAKQKAIDSMPVKERPPDTFQRVDKPIKGEKKMPSGLFIKSVETHRISHPITKGQATISYSPEGLVEQAIVQITDGKEVTWSLIFNPISGHADMVNKAMTLKDLESQ